MPAVATVWALGGLAAAVLLVYKRDSIVAEGHGLGQTSQVQTPSSAPVAVWPWGGCLDSAAPWGGAP